MALPLTNSTEKKWTKHSHINVGTEVRSMMTHRRAALSTEHRFITSTNIKFAIINMQLSLN